MMLPQDISGESEIEIPIWTQQAISFYNRCSLFGSELALPCSGGVLDQPESLMQILETIHAAVQEARIKKAEDEEFKRNQRSRALQNKTAGNTVRRGR